MVKNPLSYELLVYTYVFTLSFWSGSVRYLQNIMYKDVPFRIGTYFVEILTATLVGTLVFYFCEWSGVDPLAGAIALAVGAYNGPAWLALLERKIRDYLFRGKDNG